MEDIAALTANSRRKIAYFTKLVNVGKKDIEDTERQIEEDVPLLVRPVVWAAVMCVTADVTVLACRLK